MKRINQIVRLQLAAEKAYEAEKYDRMYKLERVLAKVGYPVER